MSRTTPRFVITLVSIGLVVWLVIADLGNTNPGEISAPHAGIRTLLGGPTCSECHGESAADLPDSCLACHEEVAADIDNDHGLHGNLETPEARACAQCHSEHHGAAFSLVSDLSFRLAGVDDVQQFDHAMFDYQLDGKHAELECASCHELANIAALEEGQRRYMGLDQDCTTCHDDPHEGKMEADCASCHGQSEAFEMVATFEHDEVFPLIGVHDEISCVDCHAKDGLYSVESIGGLNPPRWRSCVDCHESPHAESFLSSSYQGLAEEEQNCATCHLLDHTDFLTAREHYTAQDHLLSGFALTAPHDTLECQQCHQQDDPDFAQRFPGRTADDCGSCHQDPHADQFRDSTFAQDDCLSCHDRLQFQPATFDLERHAQTDFALEGAHAETQCATCHIDEDLNDDLGPVYASLDNRCQSCHLDAHDACFEPFALKNDVQELDCDRCHDSTSFTDVLDPGFDHATWTAFKLEGKHASNDCESCHEPLLVATEAGRSFGVATPLLNREEDSCESCHEDIHHQSFDRADLPTEIDGRQSCARCHGQEAFLPLTNTPFDHGLWTDHELRGAHARAECASCHQPEDTATHLALGKDCKDCHDDPHDQRFDALGLPVSVDGKTDCARCHNEENFRDMRGAPFDHLAWTGFELVDAHRFADCAACHGRGQDLTGHNGGNGISNNTTTSEAEMARSLGKVADHYPGSPEKCETCHSNPHDQSFAPPQVPTTLNGEQGCARCHNQVSFRVAERDFDHDRLTRFALTGAHSSVDCSQCHRPLPRQARDARSFDRAAGTSCEDCHADPHVGQFRNSNNSQCQDCHAVEGPFQSGLTFDHQKDSRYPLDKTHEDLACSSCHVDYPLGNGRSAVRYRPLGTQCSDCHGLR